MSGLRITGIIVAIAVAAGLEFGLRARWYVSLPLGIFGYLATRYVGWAIKEHRRPHRKMAELIDNARGGKPLD